VTVEELLKLAETNRIRRFDLRVTDLLGRWQHWAIPINKVKESLFEDGNGFDGSSLRGFQQIQESDMLAMPDLESAVIDPIPSPNSIALICDVTDPLTRAAYSRDPRNVGHKAEEYLRSTGIADTAYFGPERSLPERHQHRLLLR
jgi:glutamine synthetase